MNIDKCAANANGKTYIWDLLRESRREGKRTVKTTVLNVTPWCAQTCEEIQFAL